MDAKVKELVEWAAKTLYENHHPRMFTTFEELKQNYGGSAEAMRYEAREILSHPDLALIDREGEGGNHYGNNWHPVIPLAGAIKES